MISGVDIFAWSLQTQYAIMSGPVAVFLSAYREFQTCLCDFWNLNLAVDLTRYWYTRYWFSRTSLKLNFKESMSTTLFINILSLCVFTCMSVFQPSCISPFVQCGMFFAVVLGHYVIHFYPTLIQRFYHNAYNVMKVINASQRTKQRKAI